MNTDTVQVDRLMSAHWEGVVQDLIAEHVAETGSKWASALLAEWDRTRQRIWQVCPKEMVARLAFPLDDRERLEAAE